MPGERRTLRSSKDTSSSTNGEKARSNSQSSNTKDKPVPTRTTSSKGKTPAGKADKPHANGGPVENGVNGTEDIDMVDDGPEKVHNGEEEMTVVVPPSKSSKLAGEPGKDAEGDVPMDGAEKSAVAPTEEPIDPKVKAVTGQYIQQSPCFSNLLALDRTKRADYFCQISRPTLSCWSVQCHSSTPALLCVSCALCRLSENIFLPICWPKLSQRPTHQRAQSPRNFSQQ